MTKLHCNAVHCEYNNSNYCCLPNIQVGGGQQAKNPRDTCCDSFKERSAGTTNQSSYNKPDPSLSVMCSALSCKYNANGQCSAKAIQIGGATAYRSHDTECDTFSRSSGCSSCKNCMR